MILLLLLSNFAIQGTSLQRAGIMKKFLLPGDCGDQPGGHPERSERSHISW
jgi:hypothetical protein